MQDYILVVDDYYPFRLLVRDILKGEGYSAQMVTNGTECLELAFSDSKPSLILLDWQMPGLSGYEVLKELKSHVETEQIPVIMITGELGVEDLLLEAGALRIFSKPLDFQLLLAEIRRSFK